MGHILPNPASSRMQIVLRWLSRNPLVAPAIGLIAGIMIDECWAIPLVAAVAVFVGSAALIAQARKADVYGFAGIMLASMAVGTLLHDTAWRRWSADHVVRCCSDQPVIVRLRGTVISTPMIRQDASWFPQDAKTRFTLATEQIESQDGLIPASGLVSVLVHEPMLALAVGERIELYGRLRRLSAPANPGCVDFARISRRNGILVHMTCLRADDLKPLFAGNAGWRAWIGRIRLKMRSAMLADTYAGDMPGSGLLAAMVLGQRSAIDPALNEAFLRSGALHYLSVSGAHVGMLVGAVFGLGMLVGASRRQCAIWAMGTATAYAVLAEPSAPLIRATILVDVGCLALLARREMRVANWLAASAIILLVVQPTQLFDASFQLSYMTLLSVIYLFPCIYEAGGRVRDILLRRDDPLLSPAIQIRIGMRKPRPVRDAIMKAVGSYLAMGSAAWAVGSLLGVYHFQQLQMWGWFNSIVLMPVIWLTMVIGLVKTVVAMFAPSLAGYLAWPLSGVTDLLIGTVQAMARMSGSGLCTPRIPLALVWLGLTVALIWIVRRPLRLSPHAVGIAGLAFAIVCAWSTAPRPAGESLKMYVLAVGNASATVLELPNGSNLLYDIGGSSAYDVEKWVVGPLLARDRCRRVDAALISHANLDHYSGLSDLLDRRSVSAVIIPPQFEQDSQWVASSRELMSKLNSRAGLLHKAAAGDHLSGTGAVDVEVLWPPRELKLSRSNDDSMVVRVTYAGRRILLCGDIEEYAIRELLAHGDVKCDVLLLPHHGSVTPSTAELIRTASPELCLQSSGRPVSAALRKALANTNIINTAEHGCIEMFITPSGLVLPRNAKPPR